MSLTSVPTKNDSLENKPNGSFAMWIRKLENHPLFATIYSLAKQSAVYFLGTALIGLGNFALVPLYARCLGSSDFGIYALIEITLLITVTATQMGIGTAYIRWFPETPADGLNELLGTSTVAVLLTSFAGGILLLLIARLPGISWFASFRAFAWVLLPLVLFRSFQLFFFSVLQAWQRPVVYVIAAITRLAVLSLAGIWLVAFERRGLGGMLQSWLLADAVCFLILAAVCFRRMHLRIRTALLRPMLSYSLPLVWTSFLALLLDASGRFFLARYQSLAEVGIYAVAIKLTNIPSMLFLQPFGNAWAGIAFPIAKRPNAPMTYTKILGYAFTVLMLMVALMILFAPFLVSLFAGPGYGSVPRILPILLLAVALRPMEYWSCMPLYLKYKTKLVTAIYTPGLGLCLILNVLLVPRLGALGAAVAWCSALVFDVILMTILGRRHYSLPIDSKTLGFAAGMWLFAVLASWMFNYLSSGLALTACTIVAIFFVVASAGYFQHDFRLNRSVFAEKAYAD